MKEFAKSISTVMDFQTIKLMNKKPIEDKKVYKSEVKITLKKKKVYNNNTSPSYPDSPYSESSDEYLI
ncbi:138_t:CDS:2 [Funneliformis caledonium]|uniref:138_t:CDS:1 n=1 Tax=Funneliformis caledonium TaxID=1117310 RepID=A0A9N9H342_9GLOM|nr:138_t:CDS:2 [Funneliformis caledonium]